MAELQRFQGTVRWFSRVKGYGFIQPDEGGNDVFVHISAVERAGLSTLREGQKIGYETETGRNGKVAAVKRRDEWESQAWGRAVRELAGDDG